jgi:hypothetical protein
MSARTRGYDPHEEMIVSQAMGYAEELMHSNPGMDSVRAQQQEISSTNRRMYYDRHQESYETTISAYEEVSQHLVIKTAIIYPQHCTDRSH